VGGVLAAVPAPAVPPPPPLVRPSRASLLKRLSCATAAHLLLLVLLVVQADAVEAQPGPVHRQEGAGWQRALWVYGARHGCFSGAPV